MNIQLKDEQKILSLTNEENEVDNFLTLSLQDEEGCHVGNIDLDILELYSAVLSFITLKKKNEERDEHYVKRDYTKYLIK